jgi:hypothetical protein
MKTKTYIVDTKTKIGVSNMQDIRSLVKDIIEYRRKGIIRSPYSLICPTHECTSSAWTLVP